MSAFLIHIHTGPDAPTKAPLGLNVAARALEAGHTVTVFLAGDAVHLFDKTAGDVEGLGTGRAADHLAALVQGGAHFYLSGNSAKARGYDAALLDGRPAAFAMPEKLVDLADAADTVLCY